MTLLQFLTILNEFKIVFTIIGFIIASIVGVVSYRIKFKALQNSFDSYVETTNEVLSDLSTKYSNLDPNLAKRLEKQVTLVSDINNRTNEIASDLKHTREYTGRNLEKIEQTMRDIMNLQLSKLKGGQ